MGDPRPPYALRPATGDDFEIVRRLHHETLGPHIQATLGKWDEPFWDQALKSWFHPERIQIIQSVIQRGKDLRLPVHLSVLKANPTRTLYERLGFQVTGVTSTHCEMIKSPPT